MYLSACGRVVVNNTYCSSWEGDIHVGIYKGWGKHKDTLMATYKVVMIKALEQKSVRTIVTKCIYDSIL